MAAATVGGAFLSAFLQVLFDRMAKPEFLDFIQGKNLNGGLLTKLKIHLLSVDAVLNDAEERQTTNLNVKEWLNELKDAMFEAEDIIDELNTEASLESESEIGNSPTKVQTFFSSALNLFNRRTEKVLDRLDFLIKQKDALGLKNNVSGVPIRNYQTTSVVESSGVFGRHEDTESIIEFLLADHNSGDHGVSVLPIVGMGGVGKTTLAQLVYNDPRVTKHFGVKAWVCVSQEFDVLKVTNTITQALSLTCDAVDLNQNQIKLKEFLNNKKFLIVLDDVWNENYIDWEILRRPFEYGASGSKIVVTTQSKYVASVMRTAHNHYLKELSDDDCWLLFSKHAFAGTDLTKHPGIEAVGRKIVHKCKGLPLAAKALGGLLRSKVDRRAWDKVLHSEIWNLPPGGNIIPALWLSYHHLPSHLKRCFAFCSIFPKNFKFRKEDVVQLWMAEDLFPHPKINGDIKKTGIDYFNELVSRSFFQPLGRKKSYFIMHDLINDLAEFVSGEFSFRLEGDNRHLMSRRTRQLSYSNVMFNDSQNIKTICEAKGLRSFISLEVSSWSGRLTNETLNDLLSKLRSLRVLSLSHCQSLTLIPDSLGQLIHLRYLDLSHTAIMKLPDSLCSLYNLQTLLLFNCHLLTELPINIGRLINLRCLNISGTKLIQMPLQIGRLENLHRLTVFTQGKRGSSIQELKRLNCLEGKLSLLNLQNVVDPKDALEASLKDKGQLHELVLKWSGVVDDSQKDRDVLTHLEPPQRLKKIAIEQYGGTKFPDWLGDRKFSNMVSIYLHNCSYCTSLPPLGKLASLKNLSIVGLNVVSIGAEFYGSVTSGEKPFNSLQNLHFENMFELRQWETSGDDNTEIAFPFLRKLSFKNCPNLTKGLPQYLPSLTKLVIIKCQQLVAVLPISATVCEMQLEYCENVPIEELPPNLMKLTLGGYNTRESLFEGNERGNCCIEQQNISYFQSLVYLPIGSMADKIRSLNITNCRNIDFPKYQCFTSLERLFIKRSCNSLKSFELGFFPKLNNLYIYACQNLESISFSRNNGQNLLSLNSLIISECPNFVSFPDGGLPAMNLTCFRIEHCMNLRSLPELMNILLSSLVTLTVWDCPALESFPEGGLPPSLQSLEIYHCDRLFVNRKHWNLQSLPSLGSFAVGGNCEDGEPFPEEGLLPSTITSLNICKLENLKYLNEKGLQNLTSLKTLGIGSCSELQFIPQKLPASLSDLHIWNSPCLEQRCQWGKEDWPKISQIPTIRINSKCI